jgi:hypothetical protein
VLQFCPHVAPPVSPTKKPNPSYRTRRRRRGRTGEKAAEEEKEGGVPERRLPMEEIAGGGGEVVMPPSPSPTRSREIAASSPHRLGPSFCGPIQRFTRTVTYRSGNIVLIHQNDMCCFSRYVGTKLTCANCERLQIFDV